MKIGYFYKLIIISLLSLVLASCGFHLRNKNDLPPQLSQLYIKSDHPYAQFESKLKQTLQSLGITLVGEQAEATYTLNILSTNFSYNIPSISTSNQAQSYSYSYSVSFNIIDKNNKVIVPAQAVSAGGNLILQPNEVLGSNSQTTVLEDQLQTKCVDSLYEILTSQKIRYLLNKTHIHHE